MSQSPQNEQEAFVRALCRRGMAGPFTFYPNLFRKGKSGAREPADLVWACNRCAILMHMRSSVESCDKAIEHSVTQVKGCLRMWQHQPLTGNNAFHSFSINRQDVVHVVVLSIVNTDQAYVRIDEERAKDIGVTVCATVPEAFLHTLVAFGGTSLDLLLLLKRWRKERLVMEADAMQALIEYRNESMQRGLSSFREMVGGDLPNVDPKIAASIAAASVAFGHLRRGFPAGKEDDIKALPMLPVDNHLGILADIRMEDSWKIITAIAVGERQMRREDAPHSVRFPLTGYSSGICFIRGESDKIFLQKTFEEWRALRAREELGPGPFFTYNQWRLSVTNATRSGPSNIELLLRGFSDG